MNDKYLEVAQATTKSEMDAALLKAMERIRQAMAEQRRQEKVSKANRRVRRFGRPELRAGRMLKPRMVHVGIFSRATR